MLAPLLLLGACQSGAPKTEEGSSSAPSAETGPPNTLTAAEKADGWKLLFDGQTTNGWHVFNRDTVTGWAIENGELIALGEAGLEGLGKGKGETGKPGNQGDPGGDPNADRVTGISTGSGVVEGLGGRGATTRNTPQDNSSETGTVVVRVCIDKNGNVVEAKFSQKGEKTSSTVTSGRLVNLAVESAKKWKFSPGEVDKQCGWIIFNFKAK